MNNINKSVDIDLIIIFPAIASYSWERIDCDSLLMLSEYLSNNGWRGAVCIDINKSLGGEYSRKFSYPDYICDEKKEECEEYLAGVSVEEFIEDLAVSIESYLRLPADEYLTLTAYANGFYLQIKIDGNDLLGCFAGYHEYQEYDEKLGFLKPLSLESGNNRKTITHKDICDALTLYFNGNLQTK